MEIVLFVLLGVVALWAVFRLVSARHEKSLRDSPEARAVRSEVAAVGHYDGSDASKQRAYETFIDLAAKGPFETGDRFTPEEMAQDFADSLTRGSGPILLEAAWTVVGAHRFSYPGESPSTTQRERDAALREAALFSLLFGEWSKAMVKKYRVGTPAALRETQLRTSLAMQLMLDRCERLGTRRPV